MNKNLSKKSAERVVNSSLNVFINNYMNKTLKIFGRFFVSGFAFAFIITSLSFVSSTLSIHQAYASSTPVVTEQRTLKLTSPRMTGNDVKDLQTYLNTHGYDIGTADAIFGNKTKSAVISFQTANNLTPDGSVGPMTKALMNNNISSSLSMAGCFSGALFSTITGKSCANTPIISTTPGCTSDALFNTSTGASCANTPIISTTSDCTSGALFNTTTGASCGTFSVLSAGCTSGAFFNTSTGASCGNTPIVSTTPGCTSNALFNTSTGASCQTLSVLPAGCTSSTLFSTTTGVSCTTDLSQSPIIRSGGGGGGSGGSSLIQLTISNPTLTTSKEYDRTTGAVVTAGSLNGVIDGDSVTVSAVANYNSVNIGSSKTITIVYTISGTDRRKYIKPVDNIVYTGIITTKQLTASLNLTLSKPYDGNTTAVATAVLIGVAGNEDVSPTLVATYYDDSGQESASVGTGKFILVNYAISGASSTNYIRPINYSTSSGVITKANGPVAPSAPTLVSKTSTNVTLTANALNQFSSDGTTWQDSNIFNGLTTSTSYTFYTRVKATSTNNESLASVGTVITTLVITPTFSPSSSGVVWGTIITITSSGSDAIYYTIDGSDPTISSTNQAFTPLVINSAVTVKALAVKAGYDNSAIGSASYTQMLATVPSSITLALGGTAPVGGVINVAIPSAGGTDTTGLITGYVATTADNIKFTVVDGGSATSTITIGGAGYTSGADYQVPSYSSITIVVTTIEANKVTVTRTFTVSNTIKDSYGNTYGIVTGPESTPRIWLDHNLGASRVATSATDWLAYGSLFQWGRGADGHQFVNHTTATAASASGTSGTSNATTTSSATDTPGNALFIKISTDWRSTQNDNLWQGVNGINNVCPVGFRLPTSDELQALITAGITSIPTAYSSSLKLTGAGYRVNTNATFTGLGAGGYYWASNVSGTNAVFFLIGASTMNASAISRADGMTVRCIKN